MRRLVLACSATVFAGSSILIGSTAANAAPGCTDQIDDPHPSTGGGGVVIAKLRVTCTGNIDQYQYDVALYKCATKPTSAPGGWKCGSGAIKVGASAQDSISNPSSGKQYTRNVPPTGGGRGTAWWYAQGTYSWRPGPGGFGVWGSVFSNAVKASST